MVVQAHLSMVKHFLEFPDGHEFFHVCLAMLLNVHEYQVIQSDLFYPLVGGHQQPLKGSLNHPKKVTKNCQVLECLPQNLIDVLSS